MKRTIVVFAGLLILLALTLSPVQPPLFAALPVQKATTTPAPEAEATTTPVAKEEATVAENEVEPTMADLLARLESLEATVAELYSAHEAAHATSYDQANAVNTAIYLLDNVGLHELETRLVNDGEILPGDSGTVAQVARLLTTVDWPESLAEEAAGLHEMLTAVAAALGDDDLKTVSPLSTAAHTAYHVFSHNAQMWLAETAAMEMADAPGQVNRVNTAIYLLDGAGLHALSERLSTDEEILPGDNGQVAQVARLLTTVDWPDELAEDAVTLHETLAGLAAALADDDLKAATPLADQAHEEQHNFSHHAQLWMLEHHEGDGEEHGEHSEHESDDDSKPAEHSHGG